MKSIKQIFGVFAAAAVIAASSAYAADVDFSITLDKAELTSIGETLEVSVDIEKSEAIRGIQGTIAYNRDVLEVEEAEKGAVIFDGLAGVIDYETAGKVNFSVVYAEPVVPSGNVCRLVFSLKSGTALNMSEIRIKNVKTVNADSESETQDDVYQVFDINLPKEPLPAPSATPNNSGSSGGTGSSGSSGVTVRPTSEPQSTLTPSKPSASPKPSVSPEPVQPVFDDTEGHWAKDDIEFLYSEGIVSGVTENTFEPDRSITRAEFTKLISVLMELNVAMPNVFNDVPQDSWFRQYVMLAYTAGFVTGSDGNFRPNDSMTRAELAVIADRVCSYAGMEEVSADSELFSDDAEIPSWAREGVYNASARGIVVGDQNKFDPNGITTRAQASAVIRRIYDLMYEPAGE